MLRKVTNEMKTIKLFFDYGTDPIWEYNESKNLIGNGLPDGLLGDKELRNSFARLEAIYEGLFINNETVFCYRGFESEEQKEEFKSLLLAAPKLLIDKAGSNYQIINELNPIKYFESLHDPAYDKYKKLIGK